jgi:HAMP domain-containing protein
MSSLDTKPETAVSAPKRRIKPALIKVVNSLIFKFTLIFILLGGVIAFSMYVPYMRYIKESYVSQMLTVLERTVETVIAFGGNEPLEAALLGKTQEFKDLTVALNRLQEDHDMMSVYYMVQKEAGTVTFLAWSQIDDPITLDIYDMDYIDPVIKDAWRTGELTLSKVPVTNEFGTGTSAYLPILEDGVPVGIVGVDYELSYIQSLQRQANIALVAGIILSALAALLLALHINQTIVFPVREMKGVVDAMANTRFDVSIPRLRKDELGDMQRSLIQTRDNLQKALLDLKAERDEITAMKDNLKTGVFLMNKESVIQGHYSRALEEVLAASNLEGRKFTAILAASLGAREL